jgi:hypothetical protein
MLRTKPLLAGIVGLLAVLATPSGRAEVTASAPSGFSLKIETPLATAPNDAFFGFLQIGRWWSDEHTYSGKAVNMTLDARPGGCFCERLPHGGFVKHMDVVYSAPGSGLRLSGGLGPLQQMGAVGLMAVTFQPDGNGTRLIVTYTVTGFAGGKGYTEIAPAVDGVLAEQVRRFKRFAETGKPDAPAGEQPGR